MTEHDVFDHPRLLTAFLASPWAITPEKLAEIWGVFHVRLRGDRLPDEVVEAARRPPPPARPSGRIAVLPLFGTLTQRPSLFSSGGTSTERFGRVFDSAIADPNIKAVVIDVDSPGGSVFGVPELADKIRAGSKAKQVVAVADPFMASAAYWLGSQAGELVVSPSGQAGSIGVLAAHDQVGNDLDTDRIKTTLISAGKYKVEGNPYEPLTDEGRAAVQSEVDRYYRMFVDAVARGRGRRAETVRAGFGEGRMVGADQAVREGMADRVDTLENVVRKLGGSWPPPAGPFSRREAELRLAEEGA